jgi:hypothetical protein
MVPCNILGKAGTGAVLSLDAIGLQDTYLTGTDDSFFRFKPIRHTQFSKYNTARPIGNPGGQRGWPFGQTIRFQMNPRTMGDVLSNMYLKIDAPDTKNYCSSQLGWAMIQQLEFRIDSQVIETIQGDWNILQSEFQYLIEEQKAIYEMVKGPSMYIPLNFFFSRIHSSAKPYFLTCAAYGNREITVSVTFNPATFFTSDGVCTLDSVTLITEEFVVTPEERAFLQTKKQTQIVSFVTNNPTTTATAPGPFSVNLTPNIPVRALYWFLRDTRYEDVTANVYYNERYNFSNSLYSPDDESAFPVVSETQFYLNGHQVLGVSKSSSNTRLDGSNYFKFAQPLAHGLTVPKKNAYTYSFCLHPKDPAPSGAVNFSQLSSDTTKLTGTFYDQTTGTYSINVFYSGYHQLTYDHGYVSLTYAGV